MQLGLAVRVVLCGLLVGVVAAVGGACDRAGREVPRPVAPTYAWLDQSRAPQRIAVGSCLHQDYPQPILVSVAARRPELWLMIGDNVYADATSEREINAAYAAQGRSAAFRALVGATPTLAVWDDHDYGRNDAGSEYALKQFSKTAMLDFFGEPAGSPRRLREGNYASVELGPPTQRVQLLLLDTRWFRDPLIPMPGSRRYQPNPDPAATVLGAAQWSWLETQLERPAALRVVVTSIQLLADEHGYESWGLFPHERQRFFELLVHTKAQGVVLLSGDRHRGEISCGLDAKLGYPLVELTTSSLNRPLRGGGANRFRLGPAPVDVENFGELTLEWGGEALSLELALRGIDGAQLESIVLKIEPKGPIKLYNPSNGSTFECISL